MPERTLILGGGVTGLAAGISTGYPVYEARKRAGGICASYYIRPGETERLAKSPEDQEVYRFEIGGGHWIFGADAHMRTTLNGFAPMKEYARISGVYMPNGDRYVPYPIQHNLRCLEPTVRENALKEMLEGREMHVSTMQDWLLKYFGPTLCEEFFFPFQERYTDGLYTKIAPQDAYKSPLNIELVTQGAKNEPDESGYNVTFLYPENGLDTMMRTMADRCDVRYEHLVTGIDTEKQIVHFKNGTSEPYDSLLSTLPLDTMLDLCSLETTATRDPHTSVLVLNIGAVRGAKCPRDHWLYAPYNKSGFHRVGFYSNVDSGFVPASLRENGDHVSIYVERVYQGGHKPTPKEQETYTQQALAELRDWEIIQEADVADLTWIETAYTWSWPGSTWREEAISLLDTYGITQLGRYGRWVFQGIAESIQEGLQCGAIL